MDDRVIHDVMNDALLTQRRYPENFMMIYQREVSQEVGINIGGTWRTLRVPEWIRG